MNYYYYKVKKDSNLEKMLHKWDNRSDQWFKEDFKQELSKLLGFEPSGICMKEDKLYIMTKEIPQEKDSIFYKKVEEEMFVSKNGTPLGICECRLVKTSSKIGKSYVDLIKKHQIEEYDFHSIMTEYGGFNRGTYKTYNFNNEIIILSTQYRSYNQYWAINTPPFDLVSINSEEYYFHKFAYKGYIKEEYLNKEW